MLITKKQIATALILISSINSAFAYGKQSRVYSRIGGEVGKMSIPVDSHTKRKETYSALQLVGGIDFEEYFFELGLTRAFPNKATYLGHNGYFPITVDYKHNFYNTHFDANKRFAVTEHFKIITGVGVGLLNDKMTVETSKLSKAMGDDRKYKATSETFQGRANLGAQYQLTEKFRTSINLQGQGSSKKEPHMLGVGLVLNYDF